MKNVIINPQFLGAILGFVGVICTLLWNARLSREADERRFNADRNQRRAEKIHARSATRQAIIADLDSFCEILSFETDYTKDLNTTRNSVSLEYFRIT